jgi:hypothetical protein
MLLLQSDTHRSTWTRPYHMLNRRANHLPPPPPPGRCRTHLWTMVLDAHAWHGLQLVVTNAHHEHMWTLQVKAQHGTQHDTQR